MTLFEQLKLFPKVDLHVDLLGSIQKETISKLTNTESIQKIEELVELESLKDYNKLKQFVSKLLDTLENIEIAFTDLINKLQQDNLIYAEVYVNLDLFTTKLNKKDILKTLLKVINKSNIKINLVLEINSEIKELELTNNLNLLYEFYKKGINGVCFLKSKQENFDSYQSLFSKFIKDKIDYIVVLDSKLTNQNKEIYYNAKRIIYNVLELPDTNFLNIIRDTEIILEFPITYQNYFNLYDDLTNHFIYDLYKENIKVAFTTCDMMLLDTDLLNEYCKLFNVFPFNLHDLVTITLNILNKLNISDEVKNSLILEFREKANELF